MSGRILIVEDETDLCTTLAYNLQREGYETEVAQTGRAAIESIDRGPLPDLVLLDLMLPDITGTEVCRHIKMNDRTKQVPVIMLTAKGEEIDRVVGFEVGADDYVVKPFSVRELLLRVRAIRRRSQPPIVTDTEEQVFGELRLDLSGHRAWVTGEEIVLTALEFKLLHTFVTRRGRVQTREMLLSDVWGITADVTTRTVDTHVKRLRQKLGAAGDYIETLRGVGYRFRAHLDEDRGVKLGVRGKLFFVSLIVMVPVGLASGVYLERALVQSMEDRIENEVTILAHGARDLLEIARPEATIAALDPIADRLGSSMRARVTVIGEDGAVLGDSTLSPAGVAHLDNHGGRPEVVRALHGEIGTSRRFSTTVDTDMLYVAVPFDAGAYRGVVRTSKPLYEVEEGVTQLRLLLLVGALVGMVVAVFMSGLASQLAGRAVAELVDSARSIASGSKGRIPVTSTDELGRLAGSFNQVIGDLEATVAQLGAERDHLETILDDMTEGVLALDEKQRIVRANRAACELLGLQSPEGRPLLEMVRAPALADLVARADTRAEAELELDRRTVAARAAPLRISGGCVVVLHDVTEMRRLESVRRDFVANVSHELRTPVAVIRANSETLLGGALEDPHHARAFLDGVHRNAERLSRIIADLLDLSRMEAGEYEVQLAPTDVDQVVLRAIENITVPARAKSISISADVAEGLTADADAQALDHVLLNLLDNAVKYTPAGGRVVVRAVAVDEAVRIEVEDDGPGIEPRHRNRIFERFYRVDPGRSREVGGTGLGLSIVKHLVGAMHGSLGFTPATPRGSIFWIRIRRAVTALSPEESTTET